MKSSRRKFLLTAAGGSLGALAAPGTRASAAEPDNSAGDAFLVPERKVPVLAEADVVVCGGGTAGISAAYCAARHGAKVILLERWPSLGGMATNALVNIWHTSDRTKQVIFGFVQEAVERAGDFIHRYPDFPKRPETHWFDPEGLRVVFWRMLQDAGVRVICNLTAVESLVQDGRIRAVLVDTKSGRQAVRGRIFIDATGDGDVAANAGVPFDYGRAGDGLVQGMTMMFCLAGVDPAAVKAHAPDATRVFEQMQQLRDQGRFPAFNEGAAKHYLRAGLNQVPHNMVPASGNPLDEQELTRLSMQTREHVFQIVDLWRREMPGFGQASVTHMGHSLGVRESRRVRGLKTLDGQMVIRATKQPDAIGHGFWMIDIHDPKGSGYTTWTDQKKDLMPPVGDSYHIPLGMCLNGRISNLAVVGRCASSTHEAHASVRLQSHCMVMGQGVGTCAALALQAGVDMSQFDIRQLQTQLRKDGVYLEGVP
ncbi:MAG: FAD-dependent oxidoreductase [Planctomycetota bacterium]|nr:FAD-dependent oxidoreductase [Planctomycetota bacterium]